MQIPMHMPELTLKKCHSRTQTISLRCVLALISCRLKEAVKECGTALEVAPNSIKALRHRAKALEKQGLYKQALTDIQVSCHSSCIAVFIVRHDSNSDS